MPSGITPDEHRRKRPHPVHATSEQPPQKTISELFATSKHGLADRKSDDPLPSSPNKRLKLSYHQVEQDHTPDPKTAIQAEEMYNFSSANSQRMSDIVDLTSQNVSPLRKKANGLPRPMNFSSQTGPKKLVVKNLKRVSGPNPDEYCQNVWRQLDSALSAIFEDEKLPYSKETLYNEVMIVCRQNRAPSLYKQLCDKCALDVRVRVKQPLLQSLEQKSDVEMLRAVIETWTRWTKQLDVVRSIFFFLDRSYLLHAAKPSINDMGTDLFRTHVFSDTALKPKLLQGTCDLAKSERQGNQTADQELLGSVITMFHVLGVYAEDFEPKLLSESQEFYLSWTEQTVASTSLADYVKMCAMFFAQEMQRGNVWGLDPTTKKQLEMYLEEILIMGKEERLLQTDDVGDLLGMEEPDILRQLFLLLQRRRLGENLRPAFEAFIIKQGSIIVFDEAREQEMVIRLLEFKKKLDGIWEFSFERHEGLGHSLREAFENFINKSKRSNMTWGTDNPKPGEMIAKYVDVVLKGGTKAIKTSVVGDVAKPTDEDSSEDEDVEITKQLDQVLDLFRFVHGKAVFEAFYKRDLARRLLLGRSASSDAEKSMLTRLKSECGAGFTHNLEQMFKDIEMTREEISSYKSMLEEKDSKPAFDLSVNVLSSSAWPSYPEVTVNVPENILKATAGFEQYYKSKHSGRKLEWKHALAHCQVKASFPKGNKEIVVSSFQAIVLLAFNSNTTMSYADLKAFSGLDDNELQRTLQSLACAKYQVLRKSPKGKDVSATDTFSINDSFTHQKYRIKINQIQAKETKQENKQTHERVAADRDYETQAAIVRIMKGRKKITEPELVAEVINATKSRGALAPADIKRTIEKLIDKDYMERDEEERNIYHYVA